MKRFYEMLYGLLLKNNLPAWLEPAFRFLGVAEVAGKTDEPLIKQWLATVGLADYPDETAWCSAFVNAMVEAVGLEGTKNAAARRWLGWGDKIEQPRLGCVVVFCREARDSWKAHVAFYLGEGSRPGLISVIGGNQENRVSIAEYAADRVLGYRWPKGMKDAA